MKAMSFWKIPETSPLLCGEGQKNSLPIPSGGEEKRSQAARPVVMGGWGLLPVLVFQGIAPCRAASLAAGCNTEACSELSCIAQLLPHSRRDMGAWVGFLPP